MYGMQQTKTDLTIEVFENKTSEQATGVFS
jgi:hypothetical protein